MSKSKKKSKAKGKQQMKIPNTGRIDAIAEIEKQAEVYRQACAERMAQQVTELEEQDKLTDLLKKHELTEYVYEDEEGTPQRAYIPDDEKGPRAKVQKVKKKAPVTDAE